VCGDGKELEKCREYSFFGSPKCVFIFTSCNLFIIQLKGSQKATSYTWHLLKQSSISKFK